MDFAGVEKNSQDSLVNRVQSQVGLGVGEMVDGT